MNDALREVREALQERLTIISDTAHRDRDPEGHLQTLMAASQRLDQAIGALGSGADPLLRHYLDRQSYVKALAHLQGTNSPLE